MLNYIGVRMRRRLLESPTLTLLGVFVVVFAVQSLLGVVSGPLASRSLFALSTPRRRGALDGRHQRLRPRQRLAPRRQRRGARPRRLPPLERETTALRFHAFFLLTGALAGLAEVWFAAVAGSMLPGIVAQVNVLGASGAIIFALFGYLLTSNRLTDRVVGNFEVSPRVRFALFAVVAGAITVATASQQVALVAHFTGLLLGLLAGRLRPPTTVEPPHAWSRLTGSGRETI